MIWDPSVPVLCTTSVPGHSSRVNLRVGVWWGVGEGLQP